MKNYSSDWIRQLENIKLWNYYWYQLNMILNNISDEDRNLEIGVGSGFLSNYLRAKGYNVATIDIDPDKNADITADIVQYEFKDDFDNIFAFEVFEHIPFHDFEHVLGKLHGICKKHLFFSIPRNEKVWVNTVIEFPGEKKIRFRIATKRNRIITKHHYWEVDYKQYTKKKIEQTLRSHGFEIVTFNRFSSLYFYMLKKS